MYTTQLRDNESGKITQMNSSFRISENIPGRLSVNVRPPRPLRAGSTGRVQMTIENTGFTDISVPSLILQTGGNSLVHPLDTPAAVEPAAQYEFLPLPPSGPGGILAPCGSTTVDIAAVPNEEFGIEDIVTLCNTQPLAEDSTESHAFADQRDELKPPEIPDDVWEDIWDNFMESVGPDWDTFNQRMSEVATERSLSRQSTPNVRNLVEQQLGIADGILSGEYYC